MRELLLTADRWLRPFERVIARIAGLFVIGLMVLGVAEVASRSLFNRPIPGTVDLIEQFMVPIATLGAAYCQSLFGNVRMTLVLGAAKGRVRWLLEAIALAIAGFVVFVFVRGSYENFSRSWSFGGNTPDIGIPLWIGILAVTFALAVLLLRILVQFLECVRMLGAPDATSDIVPLEAG